MPSLFCAANFLVFHREFDRYLKLRAEFSFFEQRQLLGM